jgi:hypothetical protein
MGPDRAALLDAVASLRDRLAAAILRRLHRAPA